MRQGGWGECRTRRRCTQGGSHHRRSNPACRSLRRRNPHRHGDPRRVRRPQRGSRHERRARGKEPRARQRGAARRARRCGRQEHAGPGRARRRSAGRRARRRRRARSARPAAGSGASSRTTHEKGGSARCRWRRALRLLGQRPGVSACLGPAPVCGPYSPSSSARSSAGSPSGASACVPWSLPIRRRPARKAATAARERAARRARSPAIVRRRRRRRPRARAARAPARAVAARLR